VKNSVGLLARDSSYGPAFPLSQWQSGSLVVPHSCGAAPDLHQLPGHRVLEQLLQVVELVKSKTPSDLTERSEEGALWLRLRDVAVDRRGGLIGALAGFLRWVAAASYVFLDAEFGESNDSALGNGEGIGLAILRSAWINLDMNWARTLVAAGSLSLAV
jgi:hypothetical protein